MIGFNIHRTVYFDNNATTQIRSEVLKDVSYYLKTSYGNPSSVHRPGFKARLILENSRSMVARCLNCKSEEIFFTSGGTEANNLAIQSLCLNSDSKKKHIITTSFEHSSVLDSFDYLHSKGFKVSYLKVNSSGFIDREELKKLLDKNTLLVSIMYANNEVGSIQNIKTISKLVKENGSYFHTDCVQTFGKIPIDLMELFNVDLMSISAHKIHGPKGSGALFVRKGVPLVPLIRGGHQERTIRGGTENLSGIVGFGKAAELICKENVSCSKKYFKFKNRLFSKVKKIVNQVELNGSFTNSLPSTINLYFPGVDNKQLQAYLSINGICTSIGAACSEGENEYSPVLTAMGYSVQRASQSLRISFGRFNKLDEIDYFIKILQRFFEDDEQVNFVNTDFVSDEVLNSEEFFIIDVRWEIERKIFKGFKQAHQFSVLGFRKMLDKIPNDKKIFIYCQNGMNAIFAAFYLKSKGFKDIYVYHFGLTGLRHLIDSDVETKK
ncbi:IscS subfamily cysteine desulfurase [bacterium]|nr:IscS subfamily cysteine desulfurase [bacterium]